jgi:hypothetical protein
MIFLDNFLAGDQRDSARKNFRKWTDESTRELARNQEALSLGSTNIIQSLKQRMGRIFSSLTYCCSLSIVRLSYIYFGLESQVGLVSASATITRITIIPKITIETRVILNDRLISFIFSLKWYDNVAMFTAMSKFVLSTKMEKRKGMIITITTYFQLLLGHS